MKIRNLILIIVVSTFLTGCATTQTSKCPAGYEWDEGYKVCKQMEEKALCPDDSMIDLKKAVEIGIDCVKVDRNNFDKVFAVLISIARKNPDINNGEIILNLIKAVAMDAPYIPERRAKMKWNRYFSPYMFVTVAYKYEKISNYCDKKNEIKRQIQEELKNKKTGLLDCMADQDNKAFIAEQYRQSEEIAVSLEKSIDAVCKACCEQRNRL